MCGFRDTINITSYPFLHRPMIRLDERFSTYLNGTKTFLIDDVRQKVRGYGYRCDGSSIIGYYVITDDWRLNYDNNEQLVFKEEI